jgi:hypothetical protein
MDDSEFLALIADVEVAVIPPGDQEYDRAQELHDRTTIASVVQGALEASRPRVSALAQVRDSITRSKLHFKGNNDFADTSSSELLNAALGWAYSVVPLPMSLDELDDSTKDGVIGSVVDALKRVFEQHSKSRHLRAAIDAIVSKADGPPSDKRRVGAALFDAFSQPLLQKVFREDVDSAREAEQMLRSLAEAGAVLAAAASRSPPGNTVACAHPTMTWPLGTCSRQGVAAAVQLFTNVKTSLIKSYVESTSPPSEVDAAAMVRMVDGVRALLQRDDGLACALARAYVRNPAAG